MFLSKDKAQAHIEAGAKYVVMSAPSKDDVVNQIWKFAGGSYREELADPLLFMLDVINGYKTVFPIPLAQGASFEPELSEQCASVAAKEASVSGLHVTFAPMTDLVRDARWGRVMESTGEDPYVVC